MVGRTFSYQLLLVVLAATGSSVRAECTYQPDTDYSYGEGMAMQLNLTKSECCQLCENTSGCAVSVHSADAYYSLTYCWLKDSTAKQCQRKGASACFPRGTPPPPISPYVAVLSHLSETPVISADEREPGHSDFAKVFNPTWIVASAATNAAHGLLIRSQNCTSRTKETASVLTFAALIGDDRIPEALPTFARVTNKSVVFAPEDESDERGDEDPRVTFDFESGIYYMLYTCSGKKTSAMCLATATDPTNATSWVRHGSLGFGEGSKSGAMLIRKEGPHFLYWGAGKINLAQSKSLTKWTPGSVFINDTAWGNPYVEAGPPPMELSTGDYIFFLNSWYDHRYDHRWITKYQPAWVVLSGKDPTKIIGRAAMPLFSTTAREYLANKAWISAAHPIGYDAFRIYFGGADAVIGSAVVNISLRSKACVPEAAILI